MLSQFIVIISFTLIFSLFEIIETPYFHELGHVLVANKYKRTDCRILLRRGYGISSKHIKVKTNCDHQELSNDALGQSCLENMYQGYTEKQIAIIARAGCINACVYVCIMSLIFFLVIQGFMRTDYSIYIVIFHCSITVVLLFFQLLRYLRSNTAWGDRYIVSHQKEFQIYMQED